MSSKYYNSKKLNLDENYHFILESKIEKLKEKYNKSNKYVLYLDYEDIGILFKYIEKQQKEIKSLTDENNFLKEMYRGTTEYKAIKKKVEELGWN